MKTLLLVMVFLILVWLPVLFKIYGWEEGLILTFSLSIASYLIDRFILDKRKRKDVEE